MYLHHSCTYLSGYTTGEMTKARGRICVPIHIHLVDDDGGDTVGEGWMPEGDVLHSDGRFETDGDVTRLSGERETHSITDCRMQQHLPRKKRSDLEEVRQGT